MSPPCVATIFEGDNGGATTSGTSATEIRIAIPGVTAGDSTAKVVDALVAYFNERFEFYGRRLVPVYVPGATGTPETSRAMGAAIATQNVFAAVTGWAESANVMHVSMVHELARQGVISVLRNLGAGWSDEVVFDPLHPYVWSALPSTEDLQANIGDFACTALAGRPAKHAGDPALREKTRRFAIISAGWQVAPRVKVLDQLLTQCTGEPPLRLEWTQQAGGFRTGLEKLASSGATTVILMSESWTDNSLGGDMQAVKFRPEWIVSPSADDSSYNEASVQGARGAYGDGPPMIVGAAPKLLPLQARPEFAVVPLLNSPSSTTKASLTTTVLELFYNQFLTLAAGIQGAGPQLTADAFAAGLMAMQFPNPGAGQPPFWQPSAGFGPGDHSLYDDFHVGWWSDTAEALDLGWSSKPAGSWCYLGQGARYRVGTFPANADDLLFNSSVPCR